jgi:hypothetical protein
VDDLFTPYYEPYCLQCRTCAHAVLYTAPCPRCFYDYYAVWTFLGPRIANMERYLNAAIFFGVDMAEIEVGCYAEEAYFQEYQKTTNVYAQPVMLAEYRRVLATPRLGFPYPLFHLTSRGPKRPR